MASSLPVRALKVSQFRVELWETEMKSPAAEMAAAGRSDFRACYLSINVIETNRAPSEPGAAGGNNIAR
jgi:hypothetical protein